MDAKTILLSLSFILLHACKTKDSEQQFQGISPVETSISRDSDGGFVGSPEYSKDLSKWPKPQVSIVRVPIAGSDLFAIGVRWNLIEEARVVNEVSLCDGPKCWTIKTVKNMAIYYAIPKEWEGATLTAKLRHCPDVIEYQKQQCSPEGQVALKAEHFPGISGDEKLLKAMSIEQDAIDQGIAVHAVITERAFSLTSESDDPNSSLIKNIANQGPYAFSESILNWQEEASYLELALAGGNQQLALAQTNENSEVAGAPFTKQDFRSMAPEDQRVFAIVYHNPGYCGQMRFVQGNENLLNAIGDPIPKTEVKACMDKVGAVNGGQKKVQKGLYIGGVFSLALGSGMVLLALTSHFPRSRLVLLPLMAVVNLGAAFARLFDGELNFRDFFAILNINDAIHFGFRTGEEAQNLRRKANILSEYATGKLKGLEANEAKVVLNNPNSSKAQRILSDKSITLDKTTLGSYSEEFKRLDLELTKELRYFSSGKTNIAIGGIGVIATAIGATLIYKSTERSYGLAGKQISPQEKKFDEKFAASMEKLMPYLTARKALIAPSPN